MTGPVGVSRGGEDAANAAEVISEALDYALEEHGLDDMGFGTAYAAGIVLEGLAESGYVLVQLPEPLWSSDAVVSWRVYLDGEPEDVYLRGGAVTLSGVETFCVEDIPDLVAALLAASLAVAGLPVGEEAEK